MNGTTTLSPAAPLTLPPEVVQGRAIRNVYIWVLVGVGLPGNLACLVTVLSMQFTTATFYVALLAAADSMALVMKLVFHQLLSHGKMTAGACIFSFTPVFFSCYANWVLALICFERFFTVFYPLKKQEYFTKKRVYISVVILTLAMAICLGPTPFFNTDVHPGGRYCIENRSLQKFKEDFYDVFISCLYFFIPFLLIAVFTTLIIIGLQRYRRTRQRIGMMRTGRNANGDDGSVERSISIMLLCAGLVFLLLTFPACLYHLFLKKLYDYTQQEESAQAFLLYQVVTLLADTNHAINFIIYFLSAFRFRRRFVELLKRCFCFSRDTTSTTANSSEDAIRLTQISRTQESKSVPDPTPSA